MVLTDEQQTDAYPVASMETAQAAVENTYYSKIEETRSAKPPGYPDDTYTNPNDFVSKLNGDGNKIGPGIMLRVMSGDAVNIRATSWYKLNGASPGTPVNPLNDLVVAMSRGISAVTTDYGKITITELQSNGVLTPGIGSLLSQQDASYTENTRPKAYLNWILLDEQFKLVSSSSGFEQVGDDNEFKTWVKTGLPINRNGYLYVYTSNESPVDVFFDNLQVTHVRGPLQEETHYYPFGLTMAGISSKAAGKLENRFKYNGIELDEDLGLNTYEAHFRDLDPAIGRWWQIDPKVEGYESISPYASMNNNPIRYNDPLGDDPGIAIANLNFLKGLWGGIKDGAKSTGQFIKSLGTAEGWKKVGNGIVEAQPITNIIHAIKGEDGMFSSAAKGAANYVSELPNKSSEQIGHDVGFGLEKAGEAALLSKGASLLGGALEAANGQTVFRVSGGDAKVNGFSWTPTNPATVENIRDAAGLPSGGASGSMNTAEFVTKGKVATKNIIQARPALPLDGNKGGLPEFIINPNDVLFKKTTPVKN